VTEHVVPHQHKDNEVLSGTMVPNTAVGEKESKAPLVTEKHSKESKAPYVTEKHSKEIKAPSVTEKHSKESKAPSVTEKHPTVVTQPTPIQATKPETDTATYPTTNLPSVLSGADGKSKEAIQKNDSVKDNKKNTTRKDTKILPHQPHSASSAEELKGPTSVKVGDDAVGHMEAKSSISNEVDLTSTASGLTAATSESSVSPVLGISEADNTSVNGMHSFCFEVNERIIALHASLFS
jgi:hypothetical protein